jgi:TRAP-type mannitol/chloroaromatic compound transport system permease large subunit
MCVPMGPEMTNDKACFEYKIIRKIVNSFVPLEVLEFAILGFVLCDVASAVQYLVNTAETNVC